MKKLHPKKGHGEGARQLGMLHQSGQDHAPHSRQGAGPALVHRRPRLLAAQLMTTCTACSAC
ncbi:MAG: hypothetical protein R3A10_08895 [Caldilineaceae bacterium]